MSAAAIARALSGHPCSQGGYLCRCPCPGHGKGEGDRRPSLSIHDGDKALLVRCFAGCDAKDVLEELRRRGLLDGDTADVGVAKQPHRRRPPPGPPPEPEPDPEALALWHAAEPIAGTLAERYLREHRGITRTAPPS